jgi:hypothetical protein
MTSKLKSSLIVIFMILCASAHTPAQEQTLSISDLQLQIQKMESIDADAATPADIRNLNRGFLETRRAQLRDLLTKNITAMRKYQASVGNSLTAEEQRTLEATLADWEKNLRQVTLVLRGESTRTMGSDDAGASSGSAPALEQSVNSTVRSVVRTPQLSAAPAPAPTRGTEGASPVALAPIDVSPNCYPNAPKKLVDLADAVATLIIDRTPPLKPSSAIGRNFEKLMYFAVADAVLDEKDKINLRKLRVQQFVAETARTDKQANASPNSPGAVSAVEKPGFSQLLSFALDHGAVEKQVKGTTLTLSSSPYALLAAANGGDTSENHKRYDFFNRIGVSANFNIANQTDPLSSARRKQLSDWSIKVRLNKDYSSRSTTFQSFWDKDVAPLIEQRAVIYVSAFDTAFNKEIPDLYKQLREEFQPDPDSGKKGALELYLEGHGSLSAADKKAGLRQEIVCRLKAEVYDPLQSKTVTVSETLREDVNRTLKALATAELAVDEGKQLVEAKIKELNNKPTTTFAYSNQYPATGSAFSVFKFLHERKAYDPVKLVGNAGISIYQHPNAKLNQQTMRDIFFGLSFDGSAGRSPFVSATSELDQSKILFSFTGRYQRLFENRHIKNRKADIAVAQFKLEIPIVTGVSLPFSVTFANASELIKEKHMRANFGFSFDTDKLFLLAKLKKP